MGMFDEIEVPVGLLPGEPPGFLRRPAHVFQTKDLECTLAEYRVDESGRLLSPLGEALDYTGIVELYDSNIVGSGPAIYTKDGEDAESVDYRAKFVDGRLSGAIVEARRTREPAFPRAKMGPLSPPDPGEVAAREARRRRSLLGQIVHLRYGGGDPGSDVEIVAESELEWVARRPDGRFSVVARALAHLIYESAAEADAAAEEVRSEWEAEAREYQEFVRSRA